jgi:hypothetical protein
MEELEDDSRMGNEHLGRLHSDSLFILESPAGHPHAATPSEQPIRADSTESTVPTTAAVLLLRVLSSKQGVWKLGSSADGTIGTTP